MAGNSHLISRVRRYGWKQPISRRHTPPANFGQEDMDPSKLQKSYRMSYTSWPPHLIGRYTTSFTPRCLPRIMKPLSMDLISANHLPRLSTVNQNGKSSRSSDSDDMGEIERYSTKSDGRVTPPPTTLGNQQTTYMPQN